MRNSPIRVLAVALLASGLLAPVADAPSASAGHARGPYFDLEALPEPPVTGPQIVDGLEAFVGAYPYRLTGGPTEIAAGEFLANEMKGLGYDTKTELLPPANGTPGAVFKAVTASKRGTSRPDEWILFVGHYDTIAITIEGAYDNGAGTNLIRYLAHALAGVPTNRSVMFVWYNGEEEGLQASRRHAQQVKDAGMDIAAVLGFDMVGIGYPVKNATNANCMCLYHGPADGARFRPLLSYVNFDFLGFPNHRRLVDIAGTNIRNSDERSFADQGYPTLRWTGMRRAGDYRAYHLPDDTMETIYDVAGDRSFFEQGSLNTLKSAYYTALAVDNHAPSPDVTHTVDGLAVSVDATASTDEDGAPSEFSWDFGDGTQASGVTASHTFADPGTYHVTLTVADNLWPSVTRSLGFDVTVG